MHPPLSMMFFTTLAGAAQGLMLALFALEAAAAVQGRGLPPVLAWSGAAVVLVLSAAGLAAATFHLGHPLRAWRAMAMWRTSWLSREVIVMPAFMGTVALWALAQGVGAGVGGSAGGGAAAAPGASTASLALSALAAVLALVLYVCTGMIYGAVKAIREWATPLTPVNYLLIGLASGLLLAAALAAWVSPEAAGPLARAALAATLVAAAARGYALWRNLHLAPKTTLQTALGVRHPRLEQKSQGAMGGSFNTREFFHGRPEAFVQRVRWAAAVLGFGLPAAALALLGAPPPAAVLTLLFVLQYAGLLAERWSFFAEARHPQNLYYRTVS